MKDPIVFAPGANVVPVAKFLDGMSITSLVALHNQVPGWKAVKTIKDRKKGEEKIVAFLNNLANENKAYNIELGSDEDVSLTITGAAEVVRDSKGNVKKVVATKSRDNDALLIRILTDKNPRREGSVAAQRFGQMKEGQTVLEYITSVAMIDGKLDKKIARRTRRLVKKSAEKGHIELVDPGAKKSQETPAS